MRVGAIGIAFGVPRRSRRRADRAPAETGLALRVARWDGKVEVPQDLPDHGPLLNHSNHARHPTAARAEQRIHLVPLLDPACPRTPHGQSCSILCYRRTRHSPRVPMASLLCPVAARPVGVPTIEEGRLLVDIRDVRAHLREEVESIEHAEVGLVAGVDRIRS